MFCCCFRTRSDSTVSVSPVLPAARRSSRPGQSSQPDERTRLIPQTEEPAPIRNAVVVDPERMAERLRGIVRSKEGKMVSLNTPLPFNLRNKALTTYSDPSTSRSGRFPSPQPSVETAQTSDSASHDPDNGDGEERSALNVRVVRVVGPSAAGAFARRGRSHARVGVIDEQGGPSADVPAERPMGEEVVREGSPPLNSAFSVDGVGSLSKSWGD
ncbi:hypothetical protein HETIRDRAFT_448068 [Heterobasidion irregulare TC 32-1]|uniref:Uncharacterized protein n=1 Tax=Heterobasidion irregulare (strain TC 32-1) TaxID=747525 RepID=W4KPF3_HETIT|nr:uncharacterized protein HETIRDRAFT_448068 [Heterobasidion irregulare TC 32-1]ETW87584.1 hypothetical protein HETIRDRAFT_448068 [Heterobasidion irregulare TC 32-1]